MKVRLSKKFIVVLGGALVLCGASGAAAVLLGTEKILGPSYSALNGSSCTILKTFKIRKGQSTWIRQYVSSDKAIDGETRVKTALRVARAVQEKEKADLVQIAMIDASGPKDQADMRGRMIGAQVVYVPDSAKLPGGGAEEKYSAYYVDGAPTASGEYFGLRIDMPLEDVEHLEAKLNDKAGCVDPIALAPEDGHGESSSHGESAHGEAPAQENDGGHGEAPEAGHDAAAADEHGAAEAAGHDEAADGHEAAPADDHGAAVAEEQGETVDRHEAAAEGHGKAAAEGHTGVAADEAAGGFLGSIKAMIFGADEPSADGHAAAEDHDAVDNDGHGKGAQEAAAHPAAAVETKEDHEPRTAAEGGKRWSASSAADEIRSENGGDDHAAPNTAKDGAKPATDGTNEADAAGAAWLAKFRAQQTGAAPAGSDH